MSVIEVWEPDNHWKTHGGKKARLRQEKNRSASQGKTFKLTRHTRGKRVERWPVLPGVTHKTNIRTAYIRVWHTRVSTEWKDKIIFLLSPSNFFLPPPPFCLHTHTHTQSSLPLPSFLHTDLSWFTKNNSSKLKKKKNVKIQWIILITSPNPPFPLTPQVHTWSHEAMERDSRARREKAALDDDRHRSGKLVYHEKCQGASIFALRITPQPRSIARLWPATCVLWMWYYSTRGTDSVDIRISRFLFLNFIQQQRKKGGKKRKKVKLKVVLWLK